MKCGIVGLPNVGKSTLFNALLKKRVALSANYPFATVEPNVGVVAVSDFRLEKLAELAKEEEKMDSLPPIIYATVEFVDIAGLVKGASTGEGLGNKFLSHIREVDAIIHVLRDFEDTNIIRAGSENPDSDREVIETELSIADLETLEKLIAAQDKAARTTGADPIEKQKLELLNNIKVELEAGHKLGSFEVGSFGFAQDLRDERIKAWFKLLPLLSLKPVLYVFNVAEGEYADRLKENVIPAKVIDSEVAQTRGAGIQLEGDIIGSPIRSGMTTEGNDGTFHQDDSLVICAKLEEELADLSEEERLDYLKELGIEETGLERLIRKAYHLLGLASFLTAGKKEVKAWTIKQGTKAPQAAGVIHTDFEKKFIRAQVIEYEKLMEAGSLVNAKSKGWVRTEGKDYIMKDGDVVEFMIGS